MEYHLAQINVARMIGVNIEDPIMKDFVDNLDRVNELAENAKGFVWRLKEESNNATGLDPFNDERIIVNISVWDNQADLEHFVYQTYHKDFIRRRKEWFSKYGKSYYALWWVEKGAFPTVEESKAKLEYLQANGSSARAFDFRNPFPPPKTTS